jgi:hypothetical protein
MALPLIIASVARAAAKKVAKKVTKKPASKKKVRKAKDDSSKVQPKSNYYGKSSNFKADRADSSTGKVTASGRKGSTKGDTSRSPKSTRIDAVNRPASRKK